MPIRTDLNTEALLAQLRVRKSAGRREEGHPILPGPAQTARADARLQTRISAAGLKGAGADSVEISLTANMTVEAANGIVMDSLVEQINKAIQEAGIDLTVEKARAEGMDLSPESTARRIVEFATGFLEGYESGRDHSPARVRVSGFMTLIREAIQEGFHQARDFLEGITKLSETMDQNIDRTFELANQYLDEFHQTRIAQIDAAVEVPDEAASPEANTSPEVTE